MRGDIHQVDRDPFGSELARKWTVGAGQRLLLDRRILVLVRRTLSGPDAMQPMWQDVLL